MTHLTLQLCRYIISLDKVVTPVGFGGIERMRDSRRVTSGYAKPLVKEPNHNAPASNRLFKPSGAATL